LQLNYTWDENVTNSYVSSIPTWKYQFGFTQNPGVPQDTTLTNYAIGPSTSDKRTLRTSLSFDIIQNVKTTFKHEWSNTETRSDKSRSGNEAMTFLAWGEDPMKDVKGLSSDIRRGISSNIRVSESSTYNFTTGGGATKSNTSSFTISGSYATSAGFRIPIPIWPFKGATFKNEMNITLTYDQSTNVTYQRQQGQADFQENQKNSSWKLRPSATYRFNKRVSGSLFYEMGATENKISGKYSYNEFGITVNIAIRD